MFYSDGSEENDRRCGGPLDKKSPAGMRGMSHQYDVLVEMKGDNEDHFVVSRRGYKLPQNKTRMPPNPGLIYLSTLTHKETP